MGIGMAHISRDQYATNVQPSLTLKTQGFFRQLETNLENYVGYI